MKNSCSTAYNKSHFFLEKEGQMSGHQDQKALNIIKNTSIAPIFYIPFVNLAKFPSLSLTFTLGQYFLIVRENGGEASCNSGCCACRLRYGPGHVLRFLSFLYPVFFFISRIFKRPSIYRSPA